jgi:predicted ATPase
VSGLERIGFRTVHEAAIEVINELNNEMGTEAQKAWRGANKDEFQMRVAKRQRMLEETAAADGAVDVIFLDRGCLDGHGYSRYFGQDLRTEIREVAEAHAYEYQYVLVLDTLGDEVFAARGSDGRTSQKEASLEIGKHIEQVYRDFGHKPKRVPVMPFHKRLEYVLNLVGLRVGSALLSDLENDPMCNKGPSSFIHPCVISKRPRGYSVIMHGAVDYGKSVSPERKVCGNNDESLA